MARSARRPSCLVLLFVKGYGLRGRDNSPLGAISPGTALAVKDVRWEQGDKTVVLALSKGCHFCSDSAPFYRRLAEAARRNSRLQLVAVLPQGEKEGHEYLDSLGLSIEHVKQAPLDTLGVQGTPTLNSGEPAWESCKFVDRGIVPGRGEARSRRHRGNRRNPTLKTVEPFSSGFTPSNAV